MSQICVCDREQRRSCPNCDSLGCPACLEDRALNEQADGYRAAIKLHIEAANELRDQLAAARDELERYRPFAAMPTSIPKDDPGVRRAIHWALASLHLADAKCPSPREHCLACDRMTEQAVKLLWTSPLPGQEGPSSGREGKEPDQSALGTPTRTIGGE